MKKIILGFVFSIISFAIFSQNIAKDNYSYFDKLEIGQSNLSFNFNYFLGSNSLNNEFINTFYSGGFLNDQLKRSVSLKNKNVLGTDNMLSLSYEFRADSLLNITNSTLRFSLSDNLFSDVLFNDDYYNLLFFGNANTINADFSGFNFNSLLYQKFTIGLYKDFGGEKRKLSGYAGLSIVKGQSFYSVNIPAGKVITAENGTSIQTDLNYEFNSSESIQSSYMNWLGTGASADFFFSIRNTNNNEASIVLNNFGVISWNENSLIANLDTSINFTGIELNNILDLSFSDTELFNKDSLSTELIDNKTHTSKHTMYLPATLALNYNFNSKLLHANMDIGTQAILFSNMKVPFIYIRANTKLSKSLKGIIQLAYGAYADFQLGIGIKANFANKLFIHVFSSNASAYIFPKSTFGQHLNLSLAYRF